VKCLSENRWRKEVPGRLRRSRRVDPVVHRNRGVWNSDLVGYPGYPTTKEAFQQKRQIDRERFNKWKAVSLRREQWST
jgi:hypothetical protein